MNTMIVKTLRTDSNKPETAEIKTPFAIGQKIELEYDFPRKPSGAAYNAAFMGVSGGTGIGTFEITNIYLNMIVNPNFTMIEVTSCDEAFDKIHPNSKTMLIEEQVALKRLRNAVQSLDDKVSDAKASEVEKPLSPKFYMIDNEL